MACPLSEIAAQFDLTGVIAPYGDGHINDTYATTATSPRFIIQRINHHVFKHPEEVMENIERVTAHLRRKLTEEGGDPDRETLTVIPTRSGQSFYRSPEGDYYRMYRFIEGATTYNTVEKVEHFYEAARAFGRFQKLLADFPADQLHETIVDFHNTAARVQQLKDAIAADKAGRLSSVQAEVDFALARAEEATRVLDRIADGTVPLRVTHNDTKLNNIMIDDVTGKGLCVIDLDTVMPGSLLYDYGDSLRFGSNAAAEDEKDLSKVYCRTDLFEAFTRGFTEEMQETLTDAEWELLVFSAKLMTYECGIRFLADYLNGDTYFKTKYPEHNLDRCHTQFKLVADMEDKVDELEAIVRACRKN